MPLPRLDAEQKAAADTIAAVLEAHPLTAGLSRWRSHLLPVLHVNAWHESRLRPAAANTAGEDSHGLFQANRTRGVGAGHSVEALQDPAFNTRLILDELVRRWNTDPERGRMRSSRTVGDMAAAFAALVERPSMDKHPMGHFVHGRWAVGEARRATLASWARPTAILALPSLAEPSTGRLASGGQLPPTTTRPTPDTPQPSPWAQSLLERVLHRDA